MRTIILTLAALLLATPGLAAIPDGTIEIPKSYSACPPEVRPDCAGLWKRGEVGPHIVRVQLRLHEYGYGTKTSGSFTGETERHVKSFQRNKGLSADGIIGPETRTALAEPVTLRAGAEGAPVADVQIALNRMGYGPVTVDGIMGPETSKAIEKFQKRNRVKQDGIVGPETRAKMANGGRHASRYAWMWTKEGWRGWKGFAVPAKLIKALVRQESGGRHKAVSHAGALGKWQIMPGTARKWGPKCGYPWLNRKTPYARVRRALFNPKISEDIARCYINHYWRKHKRLELVLVAYNGGPKRAIQAERCWRRNRTICTFRRETYNYVRNIMAMAGIKSARVTYGRRT